MSTRIRPGGPADLDLLLALFDEAVAWMVARGQPGQWGTEPWSALPKRVERVREFTRSGRLWIAEHGGEAAGALVADGPAPAWIPQVDEPEVYVQLLITARRLAGLGIGARLLRFAADQAREAGVDLVRVDCWAGAEGRLIGYYERNGFARTETFTVGEWPGQVLEMRVGTG